MDIYEKLRKRYHSKSGMYLNKKTCADLEAFIEELIDEENSKPIWKFNGGNPITLCKICRSTIGYGTLDKTLCDDCQEVVTKRATNCMSLKKKEVDFYCQSEIEGNFLCDEQCDHCEEYYKPLEKK